MGQTARAGRIRMVAFIGFTAFWFHGLLLHLGDAVLLGPNDETNNIRQYWAAEQLGKTPFTLHQTRSTALRKGLRLDRGAGRQRNHPGDDLAAALLHGTHGGGEHVPAVRLRPHRLRRLRPPRSSRPRPARRRLRRLRRGLQPMDDRARLRRTPRLHARVGLSGC